VVAFKTGGLKDSVFEFMWDSEQGNGYTFQNHATSDFVFACERALGTFKNKAKYLRLRENAFNSTMDGEVVSKAWLKEFFRLKGKVYVDHTTTPTITPTTPTITPTTPTITPHPSAQPRTHLRTNAHRPADEAPVARDEGRYRRGSRSGGLS